MLDTRYQNDFEYILRKFPISQLAPGNWFITGASGFIMSYFIRFLLFANEHYFHNKCKLYLLCRSRDKLLQKLALTECPKTVTVLEQDVTAPIVLDDDIDYVVHGASISATSQFASNPVEIILANTVGLNNVLTAVKNKSCRSILFLSSGAVYGNMPDAIDRICESDRFALDFTDIRSCYAESKRMGELLMVACHAEYSLPCRSVRISHTYGPGIDLNDGHVYSDFARALLEQRDIVIKGDGTATRPFCYVADAITAFLFILSRGKDGQSYNMANGAQTYSIYELAVLLAREVGGGRIGVQRLQEPDGEPHKIQIDTAALEGLGWCPEIDVVEGFHRTVEIIQENNMKKVLITGGGGFIGRNLKESLADAYEVCAPTRQGLDLTDTQATRSYLEKQAFDVVIHCANTNATRYDRTGTSDYEILFGNLRMYWSLARCRDLYGKMYYFGSGAEFDSLHYIPAMTEAYFGTFVPQDAYGFSKYLMNQDARKSENIYNLRLFGVYGKYEEWNRRFIANNICRVLQGKCVSVNQDMSFDYLYIGDLCRMVLWFIEHTPRYHDYNVCTGKPVRLTELAQVVRDESGSGLPVRVRSEGENLPYTADNSRLLAELGLWAFTDLHTGVRDMWEFWSRQYQQDTEFCRQVNEFSFD